ncbi:class I SAM-dependent methyltransferase [Bifidobacterium aemilianum]|uniref:class I SAM-dependent methyltransferase n=1 Tax=Bifidobacterium aemilianum TaxID=2493120 RepID=UPI001F303212|nr:methyltransferase [Bifidobacterium aemilianum]
MRRELKVTLQGHPLTVQVSSGVFSGNRLDLGTSVLLKHVPTPPANGDFMDLGCGWGPIALSLGLSSPEARVWALDVNERALDLTQTNARSHGLNGIRALVAEQVPAEQTFDLIWSNPPIRIGKEPLHQLLMAWLPRLNPGGAAYLVVQKNLGADSLILWLDQTLSERFSVSKHASSKGYRVIEVLARP